MKLKSAFKRCIAMVLTVSLLLSNTLSLWVSAEDLGSVTVVESIVQDETQVPEVTSETEENEPTAPAEGDEPAAPVEGDEPAAPAEENEPAAPAEGDKPAAPAEGDKPTAPAEGNTGNGTEGNSAPSDLSAWADMTDTELAQWILDGEHDEEILAMYQEADEMYEVFCARLDSMGDEDLYDEVMEYLAALTEDETEIVEKLSAPSESTLPNTSAFDQMCSAIFGVSVEDIKNNDNYAEVYIGKYDGSEQVGDLGTINKPFSSLNAAYQNSMGKSGLIIHLKGDYAEVNDPVETWPQSGIPTIIISDNYDTAYLNMSSNSWEFPDNTGFYQVKVKLSYATGVNSTIFANGNTVVFGGYQKNNFAFVNDSNDRIYPTLFGARKSSGNAASHNTVENTYLYVYGGTWSQIFGGGELYSDVTGTANLTVDGSYLNKESGAVESGAVTFDNTKLAYMEGSSNIYGGGAGNFTKLSAAEHSNVNHSDVKLSYLTTEKYVTPCGGWMGESASITLEYVTAQGVNARSEGNAADKVNIIVKNSRISGMIGSLGDGGGGVTKAYKNLRTINDFNITIDSSEVNTITVKAGALGSGNHNNEVTGVDLIIKDSEVQNLIMAELPAEYKNGTVDRIRLENSQFSKINCVASFETIKQVELINMGTADQPFLWQDYLFSGHYTNANRVSEQLTVQDSCVEFRVPYTTNDLKMFGNSCITITEGLELKTNTYATTDDTEKSSKLVMKSGSKLIISGEVSGAGTMVVPELGTASDAMTQILWQRTSNPATNNPDYFEKENGNEAYEVKNYSPTMNMIQWSNYIPAAQQCIYVDGTNGHDTVEGYGDSQCTEDTLGRNANFPVRTLAKAYELCTDENQWIVVCGPYEVEVTAEDEKPLIGKTLQKEFPVTITSHDGLFDYRNQAYIQFKGTGHGRVDLYQMITFENINFVTDALQGNRTRIFSNGYKTVYGEGVVAQKTNGGRIELYGGSYQGTVASTDLTVNATGINRVSAGGFGTESSVGQASGEAVSETVVAKLTVDMKQGTEKDLEVEFFGTAYGSVHQIINKESSGHLYLYLSSYGVTIHGDFTTEIQNAGSGNVYAYVAPVGTVKGNINFKDVGNNSYPYLNVGNQIVDGNIEIDVTSRISSAQLFSQTTKAKKINWKLSGNVQSIYGVNNNSSLNNGSMALNVELINTGNTVICGGPSTDEDTTTTGYSKNENVAVVLKNFEKSNTISRLQGFGSVTFDNCQCAVNATMYAKTIAVTNKSNINCTKAITVGTEETPGKLKIQSGGRISVSDALIINGDVLGETDGSRIGTLDNNWVNEENQTQLITVKGTTTDSVYYTTGYDTASIKVCGTTKGDEYKVPSDQQMTISCKPDAESGDAPNRVWTVTNPNTKLIIYVNGKLNGAADYASHDGSTPELAFATLEEAYNAVLDHGTIVICGDTEVTAWPQIPKSVTITSKVTSGTGDARDYFTDPQTSASLILKTNVELLGVTTFEYLQFNIPSTCTIGSRGYKLTMGHEGDDTSLRMIGKGKLNVGGGTIDTKNTVGIDADLTIHAGSYGTASATNSSENTGNETRYLSAELHIYGGIFDNVYLKGNLYENFRALKNDPVLHVENATINQTFYAIDCNYSVGTRPYQITIGKNMSFSETAILISGTRRTNYNESFRINLSIDGTGGTPYTIPFIANGQTAGQQANKIGDSSSTITLKNVTVEKFLGGLHENAGYSAPDFTTTLTLNENAEVNTLYFGGTNNAPKSVQVYVKDNTAQIRSLFAGSYSAADAIPETAELYFENVGAKQVYKLQSGVCLDGLTRVKVNNSHIDITDIGPRIAPKTLDVSTGKITNLKSALQIDGNYVAGTAENPTIFYGTKAPVWTINGSVSGVTRVRSVDPDPSANNQVTGKFHYGITIKATHNDQNSQSNFLVVGGEENSFVPMDFQKGAEMDTWTKTDESDTADRTMVYVSETEGNDANRGTYIAPVKTISAAYRKAEELYQENTSKTALDIVLLDTVTFDGTSPTATTNGYSVTFKSEGDTKRLIVNEPLHISAATTFDDIVIVSTLPTSSVEIFADGHKLICSENLKVEAVNGHYPILFGGSDSTDLNSTDMEVYGGKWNQIFGGSKNAAVDSSNLTLGKNVNTSNIGTTDEGSTGVFGGGLNGTTGKIKLTVNGGTYYRVFGGGMNDTATTGEITLNFNYGTIDRLYGGGQNASGTGNILVKIGNETSNDKALIRNLFRGSGLYAGLSTGLSATTDVHQNAVVAENVQFAAGGYSGNLDTTVLNIHGGKINCDVFAGGWGTDTQDIYGVVEVSSSVTVKGDATINGSVYGGGNNGLVNGTANVSIEGGTISGDVYGGGNAAGVSKSSVAVTGGSVGGNIYGGSYHITRDERDKQEKSEISVEANVHSVYGGSNQRGDIRVSTNVTVPAGKIVNATLYGGGNQAQMTGKTAVTVVGTLKGNVYGGGKGVVDNGVLHDANAAGTSVTVSGSVTGNVYGGGELATVGSSSGTGSVTNVTLNSNAKVTGNVYGGGKGDAAHDEYAKIYGSTAVNLDGGRVTVAYNREDATTGSVFGGGEIAPVAGDTKVTITGGKYGNIFGGNDIKGEISGTASVIIPNDSTATVANVYGGGNVAPTPKASTTISGGTITNAYGGGYGETATVQTSSITVNGGNVTSVYGGGNAAPTTNASTTISDGTIQNVYGGGFGSTAEVTEAGMTISGGSITDAFGGGNAAPTTNASTTISNGTIQNIYGGGNKASAGTTNVTVTGGSIQNVYGGNNVSGQADETNITIEQAAEKTLSVGTVYGGGNVAPAIETNVKLKNGSVTNAIYGGGNAAQAGTTNVTVEGGTAPRIFGGGYGETAITQTTNVTIKSTDSTVLPEVFGGGNAGAVTTTTVVVESGNVTKLYGGGNQASVDTTNVTVKGGNIGNFSAEAADVGGIFGGGNLGNVIVVTNVTVNGGKVTAVYGGGNEAAAKESKVIIGETGATAATVHNVYGGGLKGAVDIANVTLKGGTITNNIYGGGYEGPVTTKTNVQAEYGKVQGKIYGGGHAGRVGSTDESGMGVGTTTVVLDDSAAPNGKILTVKGSAFGGGEGTTAAVLGESAVTVNLKYEFTATETSIDTETDEGVNSGAIETEIVEGTGTYSVIEGNVYGGGDLGQIGEGSINISSNTASVSCTGRTHVTITNGHIQGSVFGGGNGVPPVGTHFVVSMGTVFGSTLTDVQGGYIEQNIYGGGTQSRLYQSGTLNNSDNSDQKLAARVNVTSGSNQLAIGGSVFGGGDRGSGNTTNASVPTTVGNVEVNITGAENNTKLYFVHGGVYGDGNLCLVKGNRTINIKNLQTEKADNLKTFYSLQRADTVNLFNSRIVLLGAVDLVETGDSSVYSINRVGCLNMKEGSVLKLDQIVKYLAALRSDKNPDTVYIDRGNNGTNNHTLHGGSHPSGLLTEEQINAYRSNESNKNVICVANGQYLEISNERGEYGPVTGLFTLQLLRAKPGEGGGFVYGSIEKSTGDFICETLMSNDNKGESEPTYMSIVDDVGGYNGSAYTYYYWYISGSEIKYNVNLTGYIGSEDSSFQAETIIPQHTKELTYVLKRIRINEVLKGAITDGTYSLVQTSSDLTSNEIAIEVKLGDNSLGFLKLDVKGDPGIWTGSKLIQGTEDKSENILKSGFVSEQGKDKVTFILHKSTVVGTELKNMVLELKLGLCNSLLEEYGGGPSTLSFSTDISILRLLPEQAVYSTSAKQYAGVSVTTPISITSTSAFTAEYQTKYIPSAFPKSDAMPMEWKLSVKPDSYYYCETTGEFFTLNGEGKIVNKSSSLKNGLNTVPDSNGSEEMTIYKNAEETYYKYGDKRYSFTLANKDSVSSTIPQNTKITMIDYSGETPGYYYYICNTGELAEIDLCKFMEMGTKKTIDDLITGGHMPAFVNGYVNQATTRFTERLVFIFDYSQATMNTGTHVGELSLRHSYHGADIMDYVKAKTLEVGSEYDRFWPRATEFKLNTEEKGVDKTQTTANFLSNQYMDRDTFELRIAFKEHDEWTNTQLQEGSYSVRIELLGSDDKPTEFPTGITFEFDGEIYSPGITNKYAVIPLESVPANGSWGIKIHNTLYGLTSVLKDETTAKFQITLFSAPDARYYNVSEIYQSTDAKFTIQKNPTYDLKINTVQEGMSQVLYQGGKGFTFSYQTNIGDGNTSQVSVSAFRKSSDGTYGTEDVLATLFPDANHLSAPATVEQSVTWALGNAVEAGTYRLVFRFGDQVEYLNLVVVERE